MPARPIPVFILLFLLAAGNTAGAVPCSRIAEQPEKWVGSNVDELVRAAHAAYESEDEFETYQDVLGAVARVMRRCRLPEDAEFARQYSQFIDYVTEASLAAQPEHELGFNVPDKQYFAETIRYLEIPDFLLTPKFLQDVSRYETLEKAKVYLRSLNDTREANDQLIFFSYTSRHLGTPDNNDSYRRLLIVVPGKAEFGIPDKWVQFGVTDPQKRPRVRNVSVVSAMPGPDGTYNAYFKDYFRTYARNGSISVKGRLELGEGDENCAACHKSGVLPIFPKKDSVPADEVPLVEAVNNRLRSYGAPRFGNYLNASKLGPGLSTASFDDRARRFGTDFGETAVAHAMSCSRCHSTDNLGDLNWPMDRVIVSSFIKGGRMPYGHQLTETERARLYDNLIGEYFAVSDTRPGILKSWLLGKMP
jgi:hypothetical protein